MAQEVPVRVDIRTVNVDRHEFGVDIVDSEGDGVLVGKHIGKWIENRVLFFKLFIYYRTEWVRLKWLLVAFSCLDRLLCLTF